MLFGPFEAQSLQLKNPTVMSPMTRNRAVGNVPNAMMVQYCGMRLSPCGAFNGPGSHPDVRSQYFAFADEL